MASYVIELQIHLVHASFVQFFGMIILEGGTYVLIVSGALFTTFVCRLWRMATNSLLTGN